MSEQGRYAGMTVNERLFVAGLLEKFDEAVRLRDRAGIVRLLTEVEVEDADSSADAILQNPGHFR